MVQGKGSHTMATKVFYFFCQSCGGDTASYEHTAVCPYCRAGRQDFQLVGTASDAGERAELQSRVAELRAQWINQNRGQPLGEGRPRKRWGRR